MCIVRRKQQGRAGESPLLFHLSEKKNTHNNIYTYIHNYVYIYIFLNSLCILPKTNFFHYKWYLEIKGLRHFSYVLLTTKLDSREWENWVKTGLTPYPLVAKSKQKYP